MESMFRRQRREPSTPSPGRGLPVFAGDPLRGFTLVCLLIACVATINAAPADAVPKSPEPAAPAPADDAQELQKVGTQLGDVFERLTKLGTEFQTASPQRRQEIRNEARPLQQEYMKLSGRVAELFPPVYEKDPNDPGVLTVLPFLMDDLLRKHEFATVIEYGERLKEAGKDGGGASEVYGLALFAEERFEDAVKALLKAKETKGLTRRGETYLPVARKYQKLWETEKQLRRAEAEAEEKLPRVLLKTNKGALTLELFENEAPNTVANFISLVEQGFYKGITFHRVIPLFMAQGGDPNTRDADTSNDGSGGPGYQIRCECYQPNARMHFSGSLSMAHAGKDTGGSQFFITHLPTDHLNGKHTVFGRVVTGLDVVRSLEKGDKILDATVLRKRDHAYEPQKKGG